MIFDLTIHKEDFKTYGLSSRLSECYTDSGRDGRGSIGIYDQKANFYICSGCIYDGDYIFYTWRNERYDIFFLGVMS